MKLSFLFVAFLTKAPLASARSVSAMGEESKVKDIIVEATEFEMKQQQDVSEASVVYPQNTTFPAPKTYEGIGNDLGEPQHMDATYSKEIFQKIEDARAYVEQDIRHDDKLSSIHHLCKNKHSSCAFWSVIGECDNNPAVSHRHPFGWATGISGSRLTRHFLIIPFFLYRLAVHAHELCSSLPHM